jgi:hypothetical protein
MILRKQGEELTLEAVVSVLRAEGGLPADDDICRVVEMTYYGRSREVIAELLDLSERTVFRKLCVLAPDIWRRAGIEVEGGDTHHLYLNAAPDYYDE